MVAEAVATAGPVVLTNPPDQLGAAKAANADGPA
jgi:hypothetical protein